MNFRNFYIIEETPEQGQNKLEATQKQIKNIAQRKLKSAECIDTINIDSSNIEVYLANDLDYGFSELLFVKQGEVVVIIRYKKYKDGIKFLYTQQEKSEKGLFRKVMEFYVIPKYKSVYSDNSFSTNAFNSWFRMADELKNKFNFSIFDFKNDTFEPFQSKSQSKGFTKLFNVTVKNE